MTRVAGPSTRQWIDRRREQRDPTAATQQLRWHGVDRPQVPDWDAERSIAFGYHANVIAYRAATVIADTLAGLNFRAGNTPPDQPGAPAPHDLNCGLAALLGQKGRPAPKLSPTSLWRWTVVQRLVTGRNGWEIETGGTSGRGRPIALWPLTSARLKAVPSTHGTEWFTRFEYGRADDLKTLSPDQVHYGWTPSAADFRQPWSALQAARYALAISLSVDKYTFAFMENGAVPATVVGVEAFDSPAQFEAWKREWRSEYRGPDNAGRVHFTEVTPGDDGSKLSESLFIQTVGASARDSRTPETYRVALEQVAMALGVPWSKLDASGRTFDNASEEDRTFWQSTVLPLATALADEVNMGLAPRLGREVGWFDFSGVRALQPVPVAAPSEIPGLVAAGVIHPDEARPWLFLTGPAPDPPAVPEPEPEIIDAVVVPEPAALPPADDDRAGRRREDRATVDQEARRGAFWRATDAVIRRTERMWERRFTALFDRQQRVVLERLNATSRSKALAAAAAAGVWADESRGPADGLFDAGFWRNETEALARDLYEELASGAFSRLEGALGVSFALEAEFAQTFIRSRANQLAGYVTDTTYQQITGAMADGVAAGDSIPSLAARIEAVFADATGNRATVIARTEVISGHNAAALSAASSLPGDVVAGQQWIATRDSRTRPTHAEADGQIVGVGQPFTVGGVGCAYPGDPSLPAGESIQCRCTVAFLTPDEFQAEADTFAAAAAQSAIPAGRARVALALVDPTVPFDERRFRRALEVAAA